MRNLYLILIAVYALSACSSNSDDEEKAIQAVYYGTFISTVNSGSSSSSSFEYYPAGVDAIPYEVENIKDTLKFDGLTGTTTHYSFTLTVKENSSYLDVAEKFDGDSLFCWYAKERDVYKGGKYTSDDGVYVFEVKADGIYMNYAGASDEYKRQYKSLDNYGEIRYTKTGKSEKRSAEDVSLRLSCSDSSMHYVSDSREYKATISDDTCILQELSPEKDNFELDRIK